jgi:hypothetical protein
MLHSDHPDDGGSKLLWNVGQYLPDCTEQYPRRQPSSHSSPWEHQVSHSKPTVKSVGPSTGWSKSHKTHIKIFIDAWNSIQFDTVEHYLASRYYLTCHNAFRDTYPDSPVPKKLAITRLVNRFCDTGSVQDRNRSGRPSVLSDDNLDDICQTLLRSPRKSLRKLFLRSGLSYGSVQ